MLHILTGRAGSGQLDTVLRRMGSSPSPCVLIVPEHYSHETERALCRALGPTQSVRCEVLSFPRLARRAAESVGGVADPVLDQGGRILLMHKAVTQISSHLSVYRTPSRKPPFLSGLAATVDECKSYGVSPEVLIRAGETLSGTEGAKLRDIGLIYSAYQSLTQSVAADPRDTLDRLAENLTRSDWAAGRSFWVYGCNDFTAQEGAVLRAILSRGAPVTVALTLDRRDEDPSDIFGPAKRTAAHLRHLAENAGVAVEEEVLAHTSRRAPGLDFLEQNLFALTPARREGESGVSLISAPDPRTEAEWVAAEILRLVREEHYRFRDIAVCARGFDESYSHLLESVFARYGVPLFLSASTDILQKPVLALVVSLLDCAAGDYAAEDVLRCLKTGLTGLTDEERDLLENYVLTWDIRGSRWTREEPWSMHPAGYGRDWKESDTALTARLDGLRRRLVAPLERLRLAESRTGHGFSVALYRCLEEMDVPLRLEERADSLEERGDLQRAAEYRQLWDILCGGLEQCALLLGDSPMELEEFSRLFQLVLSQYDVSSIPVSLDRVTAGDCLRMTGKEAEVLFLLGADSDSLPTLSATPGLLSDHDRSLLAEQEILLSPRTEEKLRREMTAVYEICSLPAQKLYVSWPAVSGSGDARSPSFLVERLRVLFPDLSVYAGGEIPLCAPQPALERVGSNPAAAAALKAIPAWAPAVERVEQAAAWRRGRLTAMATEALYGAVIPLSATKLDQLASCHFSHFLRYGLDAQPREQAKFQATDYGTFVHFILETVLRRASQIPDGIEKLAASESLRRREATAAAEQYIAESLKDLDGESGRFRYLFGRMRRAADHVLDNVVAELASSQFRPAAFELGFGRGRDLPAVTAENGVSVRLSGFVDRVDCWEHDGKRYLRVVDYKTGKKSFDFTDIENGLGLQMLLYLFALKKDGQKLFGPEEIVPAGVLYLPARDPVVDGNRSMTDEEIRAAAAKELVRRGLVLDDPEVLSAMEHTDTGKYRYLPLGGKSDAAVSRDRLERLSELVEDKLHQAAGELAAGNIDADPYWRGEDKNACRWCDYAAACHFEPACGDKLRRQRALSAKEFWSALDKTDGEEEPDGHRPD